MSCRLVRKQISPYIDARLDESVRSKVDAHLQGCAPCRAQLEALRGSLAALGSLERPEGRPGGWERLRYQLEKQPAPPPYSAWARWKPLVAGAAGLALVAAVAVALLNSQPQNIATSAPSSVVKNAPQPQAPPQAERPERHAPQQVANDPGPASGIPSRPATVARPIRTSETGHSPAPGRSSRPDSLANRIPAAQPSAEPDPEFTHEAPPEPVSVARDVAETVSTGMAPLVVAAQSDDPVDWLTDINAEDWL